MRKNTQPKNEEKEETAALKEQAVFLYVRIILLYTKFLFKFMESEGIVSVGK